MKFIADFHIHSPFARATSKQLTPENIDYWGKIKGLQVIGTGDFTHPGWLKELKKKLEPAEEGLYKLKGGSKKHPTPPPLSLKLQGLKRLRRTREARSRRPGNDVRFILTAEISNIYKYGEKTRKIHNVVFAPSFEVAERIQRELAKRNFNITSDGRPILGLDARDLLEICLKCSEDIFFCAGPYLDALVFCPGL